MTLQDVIRWLTPRENHFYDFLERQADTAHAGALALARFRDGDAATVRDAVQAIEHEGDRIAHEMEEALATTFVTPIDREDLHKLCKELDDVLNLANGAIRSAALFGVEAPTTPMMKLMDLLVECTASLKQVVPLLRKHQYAGNHGSEPDSAAAREGGGRDLPRRRGRPLPRPGGQRDEAPPREAGPRRPGKRRRCLRGPRRHARQPRGEAWLVRHDLLPPVPRGARFGSARGRF